MTEPVALLSSAASGDTGEGQPASAAGDPLLRAYQWLPSVRGDLLAKLGRRGEARQEFERAAELAGNERERALLLARAAALS